MTKSLTENHGNTAAPQDIWNTDVPAFTGLRKTRDADEAAERMNTINYWLKQRFHKKMIKLSLDGGFTCPNRDGSKGTGGCIFCSSTGSGEFASDISSQLDLLHKKWPKAGCLSYFQNHTNTYADVSLLRERFTKALEDPRIEGLVIATRPDCLPEDVLDLLSEIAEHHFLWLELGLQTAKPETVRLINRCYENEEYEQTMKKLKRRGIHAVTHLILGLPGESREDMFHSLNFVIDKQSWGIKLHLLNLTKGSRLAEEMPDYQPFPDMNAYIQLVCDMLEQIPPEMVIHRLTADVSRPLLIAPEWSFQKRSILNGINAELRKRDSWQGKKFTGR
jgi:radical SAM protein (TIGR01212 family)